MPGLAVPACGAAAAEAVRRDSARRARRGSGALPGHRRLGILRGRRDGRAVHPHRPELQPLLLFYPVIAERICPDVLKIEKLYE